MLKRKDWYLRNWLVVIYKIYGFQLKEMLMHSHEKKGIIEIEYY